MFNLNTPFRGWIASLSNGETVYESEPLPDEKSAWHKLIDRTRAQDLRITMLRIQRGGATVHALPAQACKGYYQAYEIKRQVLSGRTASRQGCGSVVGDQVFITWIDDAGNVWQEIRPLESERVHTTLC